MPPLRRLFLKTELEPRLAEARHGQRTVLFVDAAHFVLSSFLGWVWCAARLFVRGASGRQRYNVLGALDPLTQMLIRVSNHTYINSLTVCERLWKFVKKEALHSRHHTNYADFHGAIETCLDQLTTTHKAAVTSLVTLNFQTFENVPMLPA